MTMSKLFREPWLYTLAFILAFCLRLINLGNTALTDSEASWALQALDTLRGGHALIGSQAAYVQMTTFLFFLLGPSNFLGRLWPAIFGGLLVLLPLLGRDLIGRKAALFLAFFLALDPGLTAVSRQAGGTMIAIVGACLALIFMLRRRPILAGCALGLAILAGESFWLGLTGLALALGIARLLNIPVWAGLKEQTAESIETNHDPKRLRSLVFSLAATLLFAGSLFFVVPRGVSGGLAGLPVFLTGWGSSSGTSVVLLLAALVVYQPLGLALSFWGGIWSRRNQEPLDQFLGVWALVSLLLVLIYPSRQVSDLVWMTVPMLILAARELARHLESEVGFGLSILGLSALTLIISVFIWLNLESISNSGVNDLPAQNLWIAIVIGMVIVVIAALLVAWGWSKTAASQGVLWGICSALVLYMFLSTTRSASLRSEFSTELWNRDPGIPQESLMMGVLDNLSDTHTGLKGGLDVAVVGVPSPALRWALRGYPQTTFTDQLGSGEQPSVVITQGEKEPGLAASYRGEGFLWTESTNWSLLLSTEYLPWLVKRQSPFQKSSLVMWARTDIFPDFEAGTTTNPLLQPQDQSQQPPQ